MSARDDNIAAVVLALTDVVSGNANTIKLMKAAMVKQFQDGNVPDDRVLLACTVLGITPAVDP